jgi:hypothetical protein
MSENTSQSHHPPTLQQIAGVLSSITEATQLILRGNPALVAEVRNLYTSFLTSPTTIKALGGKPTLPTSTSNLSDPLRKEILEIKETISALSKAVNKSSPLTANPTPSSNPKNFKVHSTPTYATLAASPPRPSAVLEMNGTQIQNRPRPADICELFNKQLLASPYPQVSISAAKWNTRGNLIITAGPTTSAQQLNKVLPYLLKTLKASIPEQGTSITARANVKWSRILLNRVPTGTSLTREAYTPNECHAALCAENPTYATLPITFRPSWVRDPSSYTSDTVSSLSFAFEDPDGSLASSLLTNKTLYIFGATAITKRWKQRPPTKKPPVTPSNDTPTTPPETKAPTRAQVRSSRPQRSNRTTGGGTNVPQ